ncbi:MAG: RluA family pseudouridine synthase [Helicobacteraceae bacterium]|nr:RluA family pseudouridine synthase [Helicobacteraceae bacterium]
MYKDDLKTRLDIFLSKELNISRSQALNLIKKNLVKVNDKIVNKSGAELKNSDLIEISKVESSDTLEKKSDIYIQRIYEDDDILVINKPPFLATHGAASLKEESLVDWLKTHRIQLSNIAGEKKEGIVHRLDKQTSGAMVIAKNNATHSFLSEQLRSRQMGRLYIAIIDLVLKEDIEIECYLARNPKNRLKFSKCNLKANASDIKTNDIKFLMPQNSSARYSKSNFYKILLSNDLKKELILAKLSTGRTHQIRAHLESINRHIIGDNLYGYNGEEYRIMLHSYILYLQHPKLGKMSFQARLFDDMNFYLEKYFNMESVNEVLADISNRFVF